MPDIRHDVITHRLGDDRAVAWGPLLEVDGDALAAGEFTVIAQARTRSGAPVVHEWSTVNGGARLVDHGQEGAPAWWVELSVEGSRDWTWRRARFDIFLIDVDGRAAPIAEGSWINRPSITEVLAREDATGG